MTDRTPNDTLLEHYPCYAQTHMVWWVEFNVVHGLVGCSTCMEEVYRRLSRVKTDTLIHLNKIDD